MIEKGPKRPSIARQCAVLGLSRSGYYHRSKAVPADDLTLMRLLDEQYLQTPFYGSRRMAVHLRRQGHAVNRKRVRRLMRRTGLAAIYRRPRTTVPPPEHKVCPYLLRGVAVTHPNQVWAEDITYVPMARGFMYLVAIIDGHRRKVLAHRVSNTMEASFCVLALAQLGPGLQERSRRIDDRPFAQRPPPQQHTKSHRVARREGQFHLPSLAANGDRGHDNGAQLGNSVGAAHVPPIQQRGLSLDIAGPAVLDRMYRK